MSPPTTSRLSERRPSNIVLIGLSGSGKSTIARLVAGRLRWTAVDTDELIERTERVPIKQIFADRGEPAFRAIESSTVAKVMDGHRQVVATGGGAPVDPRNRECLWDRGMVVYLRTSVDTLTQRLAGANDRPLLSGDTKGRLSELAQARGNLYEQAHVIIDTDLLTPADVAEKVLEAYDDQC